MISFLFAALVCLLVPIQTTLLNYLTIGGVKPDLCLVTTCLVGFFAGRGKGLAMGMGLGFLQDFFSVGGLGLNMMTKGLVGILSSMAASTLSNTTTGFSIFVPTVVLSVGSGMAFLISASPRIEWLSFLQGIQLILLPQALFDGIVASGVHWLLVRYFLSQTLLKQSSPQLS